MNQSNIAVERTQKKTNAYAWYVVILCMLAYIFSFIDRQILALMIEPIKADLQLSDTQFSLLHGLAFSLFYAVMGLPLAYIADRFPDQTDFNRDYCLELSNSNLRFK